MFAVLILHHNTILYKFHRTSSTPVVIYEALGCQYSGLCIELNLYNYAIKLYIIIQTKFVAIVYIVSLTNIVIHSPLYTGLRFSLNAWSPSSLSLVGIT
jgi:hypothetical protein